MSRNNPKNILINAVAAKMGGAKRHLGYFVSALERYDTENCYIVYVNASVDIKSSDRVVVIRVNMLNNFLARMWWDQIWVPKIAKRDSIDVIISLLNFGTVNPPVPQISLQRNPIYFCPHYLSLINGFKKIEFSLRRWLIYKTMQSSQCIVTPTDAMGEMIRQIFSDIPQECFRTIPHGFDLQAYMKNNQPLPESIEELISQQPDDVIKILYLTHPAPQKGFEVLIKAMKILKERGIKAVLFLSIQREDWPEVVDGYTRLIKECDAEDCIVYLGRIPQNCVCSLYKLCDIFAFASLCESFGFPMLEAMACGVPVVAADTAVNREALQESGMFYHGLDPNDCAYKLERMIESFSTRNEFSERAYERISGLRWQWDIYVEKLKEVIKECSETVD